MMAGTPSGAKGTFYDKLTKIKLEYLGRSSVRTKNVIAILIFALVWASLSFSPGDITLRVADDGASISANVSPRRLLRELGEVKQGQLIAGTDTDEQERAIFLISFGNDAAASTMVERCILSIRRRGDFHGPVVLLTDAPLERYQGIFDDDVFVLNPKDEDYITDYFTHGECMKM